MTVSSRTPEGRPGECPLCGAAVIVEPSIIIGDATCPQCGSLLWFVATPEITRVFDAQTTQGNREQVLDFLASRLGIHRERVMNNPALLSRDVVDSLVAAELVMQLESALGPE